jgi:CRP-like cAMP-binding protein
MLLSGIAKMCASSADGRPVPVGIRVPGWLIGAPAVAMKLPMPATIAAMTECSVRCLSVDDFDSLRATDRAFSLGLQQVLAQDSVSQYRRAAALATGRGRDALEHLLHQLFRVAASRRPDGSWRLDLHLPMTDVGELLGVSRQWATELMNALIAAGVVAKVSGWLVAPPDSRLVDDLSTAARHVPTKFDLFSRSSRL